MKSLTITTISMLTFYAARADAETVDASATVATAERDNTLSLQAGLLPNFTFVGGEYVHAFHPSFELATSVGLGATVQAAVIPRVRWERGPWRVAAGVGPSLGYLILNLPFGDPPTPMERVFPSVVGETSISYVTRRGLAVQAVAGYSAFCTGDDGTFDCSRVDGMPIGSLGVGWAW